MDAARYVRYLGATGVHGHYSFEQSFLPGINVFYGANGAGKTTLLHILVNLLSGDFERFAFLQFRTVKLEMSDGEVVRLVRNRPARDLEGPEEGTTIEIWRNDRWLDTLDVETVEATEASLRSTTADNSSRASAPAFPSLIRAEYFPAFRVGVDALRTELLRQMQALPGQSKAQLENSVANAVRRWLLPFVPSLTQPSRGEIERALSGVDTVAYVEHLDVGQYLDLVNSVLEGKRLTTRQTGDVGAGLSIEVNYDDGFRARGLGVLSSGEYQIASLAFSALALPESGILLIDEPEISLQLEWQRGLLSRLTRLTKCVQLIACTHSPAIAAGFDMSEVKLVSGSIDIDQEMFF